MLGYRNRKRVRKLRPSAVRVRYATEEEMARITATKTYDPNPPRPSREAPLVSEEEEVVHQAKKIKVRSQSWKECPVCHMVHPGIPTCYHLVVNH